MEKALPGRGSDTAACLLGTRSTCSSAGVFRRGDHIDVWAYVDKNRSWKLLSPDRRDDATPSPRYCGAMSYRDGRLYLFGGRSRRYPKRNYNDMWLFDLSTSSWRLLEDNRSPHTYTKDALFPGYHAKSATATVGSRWYILGGEGLNGHVSDFWVLERDSLEWTLLQPARDDDPALW